MFCLHFSGADQQDEEALIIPTAETVKQNYFLDLALANCIPLGMLLDMVFRQQMLKNQ